MLKVGVRVSSRVEVKEGVGVTVPEGDTPA
eukprot:gene9134-biopygen15021